jgi:hypothetical protein
MQAHAEKSVASDDVDVLSNDGAKVDGPDANNKPRTLDQHGRRSGSGGNGALYSTVEEIEAGVDGLAIQAEERTAVDRVKQRSEMAKSGTGLGTDQG